MHVLTVALVALLSTAEPISAGGAAPDAPVIVPAPGTATDPAVEAAPAPGTTAAPAPVVTEPRGMSPILTGVLQYLSGCGVGILSTPCNLMTCGCWGCLVQPAIVGGVETWVGDLAGQRRAAMLWPIVTAYAVGVIGFSIGTVLGIVLRAGLATSAAVSGSSIFSQLATPAYLLQTVASMAISAVLMAGIPVIYYLVSEPKEPGDDGTSFPGFVQPYRAPTASPPSAADPGR